MSVKLADKTTLLFRSVHLPPVSHVNWPPLPGAHYYTALSMNTAELGDTPADVVGELVGLTRTPEWHAGGRRSLQHGDIVGCFRQLYLVLNGLDSVLERLPGPALTDWPGWRILSLNACRDAQLEGFDHAGR